MVVAIFYQFSASCSLIQKKLPWRMIIFSPCLQNYKFKSTRGFFTFNGLYINNLQRFFKEALGH